MSVFAIPTKALAAYDLDDINLLVTRQVAESNLIEFKREPPGGRWNSDQKLNDEGRDEIIKEVIAFANSFGGVLFVGVDETADNPKRASELTPVPSVADLAERIERCFQNCIEPQLVYPEIVPLVTDSVSGEGVLLIRIQPSPVAPHWNRQKGKCYRRVGADSLEIGMLDIQSMTLERVKTADQIDAQLKARHDIAIDEIQKQREVRVRGVSGWRRDLDFPSAFSIRWTALPTVPIRINDPISTRLDLRLGAYPVFARIKGSAAASRSLSWYASLSPNFYRPALREWRFNISANSQTANHSQLVRTSGLIESCYIDCKQIDANNLRAPIVMPIEFLFTMMFGALYHIEIFRVRTGYEGLAYELEVELLTEGAVQVAYLHGYEQPGGLRFVENIPYSQDTWCLPPEHFKISSPLCSMTSIMPWDAKLVGRGSLS